MKNAAAMKLQSYMLIMNKRSLILRIGLFGLIVMLGTSLSLLFGELQSAAVTNLSNVPVEMLIQTPAGDTLYATLSGDVGGLYRSSDAGHSWQKMSNNPGGTTIDSLAIHPTNEQLLFAGSDKTLWSSQDAGRSWQLYDANLPANATGEVPAITALIVDPNQADVLYIGTAGQGVYRGRFGYVDFEPVGSLLQHDLYVKNFVAAPGHRLYAITSEGLWVIQEDSLKRIETLPDAPLSLAVDPTSPPTLYAGTVGYGVHRSTDGGKSWQPINSGLGLQAGVILRIPAIAIDEENPAHLALAKSYGVGRHLVGDGIYESFDVGQHWAQVIESQEVFTQLAIERGRIYVATAVGLKQVGSPGSNSQATAGSQLETLSNLSGVQIAILSLTIVLAGLILLGRSESLR